MVTSADRFLTKISSILHFKKVDFSPAWLLRLRELLKAAGLSFSE